ncbi:MAG TPA: hypothetical protein VLX29_10140 [Nitrospirota bacterium]|nr:hypothetical protein [Nitrospirota bacterium]
MEEQTKWKIILVRKFKRQLPLDIEHCSPLALRNIVLDVNTPDHILERIAHVYYDNDEILHDLVLCPNLSETTLAFVALTGSEEIKTFISSTRVMDLVFGDAEDGEGDQRGAKKKLNLQQIINNMTAPQKIKLAITAGKEARGLLVRESSKMIALSVLENPRITIGEVEFFAKSTNLNEDVIRKIGTNTEWSKRYSVAAALVNNPKTPVGVSLQFVVRMTDRDLGILEKSRNIPEAVRSASRNLLLKRKMGKKT